MLCSHKAAKVGSIPSRSIGMVAELVDASNLKFVEYFTREGSSPSRPMCHFKRWHKEVDKPL